MLGVGILFVPSIQRIPEEYTPRSSAREPYRSKQAAVSLCSQVALEQGLDDFCHGRAVYSNEKGRPMPTPRLLFKTEIQARIYGPQALKKGTNLEHAEFMLGDGT